MIVVLTGGSGGAKLVDGLAAVLDPAELTLVCNTGDDAIFHGLYVSPDIDTVVYTLAGLVDGDKGWGLRGDTFRALQRLGELGEPTWFKLGDQDLATHILRTSSLRGGGKLSQIVDQLRRACGVKATVLPMSDERIETRMTTSRGDISFQEFFVKERWEPEVSAVRFVGAEESRPAPGVLEAIRSAAAVVVCPSNPVTSIGPILAVPGIRAALREVSAPAVGVSPMIGTQAISGPAHKLMRATGLESSAVGVAQAYADFLDTLLIAREDAALGERISASKITPVCADIRMASAAERQRLARQVLAWVEK